MVTSCVDEYEVAEEDSYLEIQASLTKSNINQEDNLDTTVESIRVMVFNQTDLCVSNQLYAISPSDTDGIIKHKINKGAYHRFVFVANEPSSLADIATYGQLQAKAFPSSAFNATTAIPMIKEIHRTITIPSTAEQDNPLKVYLDRMAVKLDLTFTADRDLSNDFNGVVLTNLPDKVPLYPEAYSGSISWGTISSYTIAKTAFAETTPSSEHVWKAVLAENTRIIIPSNPLKSADYQNKDKAVGLTVKMDKAGITNNDRYTWLRPQKDKETETEINNYALPHNGALELIGNISESLELNIIASDWVEGGAEWTIGGDKILNVSHTEVNMTDLNGVRVSFYSNMPCVKVMPTVLKNGSTELETNVVFNDLATADGTNTTTRFHFDPETGSGYMDILADGGRSETLSNPILDYENSTSQTGTYTLTLLGEDTSGATGTQIKRTITVNLTQNGLRFANAEWKGQDQYLGVFYRNNQKGERIITGQHYLDKEWTATANNDFIILSSLPSYDPGVGTNNPGDAEKYPVNPGNSVSGKGRIYFRIGLTSENPGASQGKPRYGTVSLRCWVRSGDGPRQITQTIYVRQGEEPDYLFEPTETIGTLSSIDAKYQPLSGNSRTAAAKFSPYNLTAAGFKENTPPAFVQLGVKGGDFVDYPSQGGAFFQWGLRLYDDEAFTAAIEPFYRRAFNPVGEVKNSTAWISGKGYNKGILAPTGLPAKWYVRWDASLEGSTQKHKDVFETCPEGYRRPTDGITNDISYNGPTPTANLDLSETQDYRAQIANSEYRVSLFTYPFSGDANSNADSTTIWNPLSTEVINSGPGTYPSGDTNGNYARKAIHNTYRTFYADGFFDRRPIQKTQSGYGVDVKSPQIAYRGLMFVNPTTKASLFFPSAGRITNDWADFQGRGSTGYYWSSSVGPIRDGDNYQRTITNSQNKTITADRRISTGAWCMEIQYDHLLFINSYSDFGYSIRCVKE